MRTDDAVAPLRPRPSRPPLRGRAPLRDGIMGGCPEVSAINTKQGAAGSTLNSPIRGRRLGVGANFIYKLQAAAIESREKAGQIGAVRLFPTIDGMYITSPARWPLESVPNETMMRCAITFMQEKKPYHKFLVRGAISFGPVFYGMDLPNGASYAMANSPQIRDSILVGLPVGQAHEAEGKAAPFGISIHSSARSFSPRDDRPFPFIWLEWYRYCKPAIDPKDLLEAMNEYFDWQREHSTVTGYLPERLEYHAKLAREFFTLEHR